MKNISDISSLFNYLVNDTQSSKLVNILNQMLESNLLNEELYLNLIKGLILIFHLNKDCVELYYNIFHYIYYKMDDKARNVLFIKLKIIDLSKQVELSDTTIENIIIYTHNFIITDIDCIDKTITQWIKVIMATNRITTSTEFKISIYLYIIKNPNIISADINTITNVINRYME